jgi:membrane associated rhomboid family serine protease
MPPSQTKVESFNSAVRGLTTLSLIGTLCYGFLVDKVSAEAFVGIVSGVVSFWFVTRDMQKRKTDQGGSDETSPAPPPAP